MFYVIRILLTGLIFSIPFAFAATDNTANSFSDFHTPILVTRDKPQFAIKLPSNPTTGYSWRLLSYNPDLITPLSQTFTPPGSSMPGSGGSETLVFKVNPLGFAAKHIAYVTLIYVRPWNMNVAKRMTFLIVTQ